MTVQVTFPKAFLDVSIGNDQIGRIVVQLYSDKAPETSSQFMALLPQLKNLYFHRVIKNFMIQTGDTDFGSVSNYNDARVGSGGSTFASIENTMAKLDKPFQLCTSGSRFFITTYPASHLEGKHTVFGQVLHGKSVVRAIERVHTSKVNVPVEGEIPVITGCGEWNEGDDLPIYNACYDQVEGDIYEEFPDDDENFEKESSQSAFEAASIIKESGGTLFKQQETKKAFLKYRKSLRYVMEYIPDQDQAPEDYAKYIDLKKKLYLNLSLVCLKLKDLHKCMDYCSYLLEMELLGPQKAKTLFRYGSAELGLKKYTDALGHLKSANEILEDAAIQKELKRAEELLGKSKKKERERYGKFFS